MFTYKTVNNNVLINKHKSTYTNNKITIKPNIKTSWMLLFCFGIHQFLSTCYAISHLIVTNLLHTHLRSQFAPLQ